jgi:hypothetical protein
MSTNKFDAILFGNGMTLNLLKQLKPYICEEKRYLLNINDFLKKMIGNQISVRENQRIFNVLYRNNSPDNNKNYSKLKNELRRYYLDNNANIEKILGQDLFLETNYDKGLMKGIFPLLYNIWFDLAYEYLIYSRLENYMKNFYDSVKQVLKNDCVIYTTNFDYLADNYLEVNHLHGSFVNGIKKYDDSILIMKNDKEFLFKYIWGWNGVGKLNLINEIKRAKHFEKYFDFRFFDECFRMDSLLIYGIGFQRSGYITNDFIKAYPKYENNLTIGTVIDEHLLVRIKTLQKLKQLDNIIVSYYSEEEKDYLKVLFNEYGIKNLGFAKSSEFAFSIN